MRQEVKQTAGAINFKLIIVKFVSLNFKQKEKNLLSKEITIGQTVMLREPKAAGEVTAVAGERLYIRLAKAVRLTQGAELTVVIPDESGVVEIDGTIESEDVKTLILHVTKVHPRKERREWQRVPTQTSVALSVPTDTFGSFETLHGVTLDLSRGGLRMILPRQLKIGTSVMLVLKLNGQRVVTMIKILASDEDGETRGSFTYIEEGGVDHITARVVAASLSNPNTRSISKKNRN